MAGNRKAVMFIAMSLDGYIADQHGDISFLKIVEEKGEDYGYQEFFSTIDVVILGRKTWDTILSYNIPQPYEGKQIFVISHTRKGIVGNARYYGKELPALIRKLKAESGLDIFIDGGSQLIHTLLKEHLIDRLTISVIPVLLGSGTPLFRPDVPLQNLRLTQVRNFHTGLVQLEYEVLTEK